MHILVSECISKGLNEEKFALLNTAKKSEKKMVLKKWYLCFAMLLQDNFKDNEKKNNENFIFIYNTSLL